MRVTYCNRRHCLSIALIVIAVLSVQSMLAIHSIWLLHHLGLFYHEVILGALTFYGLYFGIGTILLESRNSLSRTFGRAHNALVLGTLVYMLFDTYHSFFAGFYRVVNTYWLPEDYGLEEYAALEGHAGTVRILAALSIVVACVQAYLVYARIVNYIAGN